MTAKEFKGQKALTTYEGLYHVFVQDEIKTIKRICSVTM